MDGSGPSRVARPGGPLLNYDARTRTVMRGVVAWPPPATQVSNDIKNNFRLWAQEWLLQQNRVDLLRFLPPIEGLDQELVVKSQRYGERRVSLGRDTPNPVSDWAEEMLRGYPSPDGRYVAVVDVQYKLRLLDLQEAPR